ncbi:MAG TPA: His/Gly/Thr/Pro-type tRNA ligase C-terminal domain-containing protein, partial [Candidatus Lokiarchaeia archaeon]|nr:His/Gly/Thr/Pro-type tRNA ligase C-terminal domain-containing protein [Candidatus Lokiarchaeia archaeon]
EHMNGSKKDIRARVPDENGEMQPIIPHIWEISIGVDRTIYCILEWALKQNKKKKPLLDLNPWLAPATVSVFPLVERPEFVEIAKNLHKKFRDNWVDALYDADTSIGKRYLRADEIGVPFAMTIDGQTLEDNTVTVRDRNGGKQIRENLDDIPMDVPGIIKKYTTAFKDAD